jgi:site-specific DNA recombinase
MSTGLYLMEQPESEEPEPKKRMAAYCRVSSDKDEQLHSLHAQKSYYEKALAEDAGCEFAGIYADVDAPYGQNAKRP